MFVNMKIKLKNGNRHTEVSVMISKGAHHPIRYPKIVPWIWKRSDWLESCVSWWLQLAIECDIDLDEYVVGFEVLAGHSLRCYPLLGLDLLLESCVLETRSYCIWHPVVRFF